MPNLRSNSAIRFQRRSSLETLERRLLLCTQSINSAGESVELCLPDLPEPAPANVQLASRAVNEFAFDLYEHYLAEEGNVFLSPLSISTAFGMAYSGADSQTADEIQDVFHFDAGSEIHDSFQELLAYREPWKLPVGLSVANAMWADLDFSPGQGFVDLIEEKYAATAQAVDFGNETLARETINEWVGRKTFGAVRELIKPNDINDLTKLILTNAVHLLGSWAIPFDSQYTRPENFSTPNEVVSVDMMYQEGGFRYTEQDGFDVLELPYIDAGASMVLLVPQDGKTADDMTTETLAKASEWLSTNPSSRFLGFEVPKFRTLVDSDLNPVLKGMGIPSAFEPAADFSKISPGLFVQQVRHSAQITVNEQGTIAGAASSIQLGICFAAGTPIMTPDGSKRIEDLKVGDLVLARDENNLEGELQPKVIENTFVKRGEVVQLKVGGQTIQTTSEHPFFAKNRGWTPCNELKPGDVLLTDSQDWREVESINPTRDIQAVYNMRVADYHTYFIGDDDWGFGIWAHNSEGCGPCKVITADKPFHFFIRDNATSAMLFMGRIDDPTQASNSLAPEVDEQEVLLGDANGDGEVGFLDFLLLSKNFGREVDEAIANVDFNSDGMINFADFLILSENFGSTA